MFGSRFSKSTEQNSRASRSNKASGSADALAGSVFSEARPTLLQPNQSKNIGC